jgi:D-arginine dehydrogenase
MAEETADIVVLGAGIAGASIAAELAADARVLLLEMEDRPGYHTTGRSAAMYIASYGNPTIRKLNRASLGFLQGPPDDFDDSGCLTPRGMLYVATEADRREIDALVAEEPGVEPIEPGEALAEVPILRAEAVAAAAHEASACEIDVARLHQAWLRRFRRRGGELRCRAPATALTRKGGTWRVETPAGVVQAPIVVNAAGAWADAVAGLAGLPPVGLIAMRRTAAILPPPDGLAIDRWPLVYDIGERYYFKPEAGKLLVSPADKTPVEPGDATVDDMVLAEGLHRFEQAVTLQVRRVERRWAGLRTFAPDDTTVVGFDPESEGFFWFAGQGGYGIQTCPAMAWLGAALARGQAVPPVLTAEGLDAAEVAPRRPMAA